MSDLGTLLRDHYESTAPPIDVDRLVEHLVTEAPVRRTPSRATGVLVAVGAALAVLLLIGGVALLIQLRPSEETPMIEEPPSTTVAPGPDDVTPDALPSIAGVGLPFTVLEREGDVGSSASVIVGTEGVPLVAYVRTPPADGPSEIAIATCADPSCTAPGTVTTVAETLPIGERWRRVGELSALLPADGLPVIIWNEWDESSEGADSVARIFKCDDPTCADGTLTDVDGLNASGLTAVTDAASRPVMAAVTEQEVLVATCENPACDNGIETTSVDLPGQTWGVAIALDGDLPVLAFAHMVSEDQPPLLTIARCTDPACAEAPSIADLGISGHEVDALLLDARGYPMIVAAVPLAAGDGADRTMLIACTDRACTAPPATTPLTESEPGQDRGSFGGIAVAPDGSITVLTNRNDAIAVLTCDDPTCPDGPSAVDILPGLGFSETDLALATSSNPVIAIYTNTDLGILACTDRTCAGSAVEPVSILPSSEWTATIAALGDVENNGANPTIEIGPDGNPVIAYLGRTADRGPEGEPVAVPKLRYCDDPGCTSSRAVELGDSGIWPVMALRPSGAPVVVYSSWNEETEDLVVAWCTDPGCSEWTSETVTEGWFASPAAVVAGDDAVTLVYQDLEDYYVYVARCEDGTCANAAPTRVESLVDDDGSEVGTRWLMNTVAADLLPDGRPLIAAAQGNGELRYVECLDPACTDSTTTVIDDQVLGPATATLAVRPDGLPLIAYYDDGVLSIAACSDTACGQLVRSEVGEATAAFIASVTPSLAFRPDGLPMVVYWAPRALMLAECGDADCAEAEVSVFAGVGTYDLAVLPDGSPVLAYFAPSEQGPEPGLEEFGWPVDLWVATR